MNLPKIEKIKTAALRVCHESGDMATILKFVAEDFKSKCDRLHGFPFDLYGKNGYKNFTLSHDGLKFVHDREGNEYFEHLVTICFD